VQLHRLDQLPRSVGEDSGGGDEHHPRACVFVQDDHRDAGVFDDAGGYVSVVVCYGGAESEPIEYASVYHVAGDSAVVSAEEYGGTGSLFTSGDYRYGLYGHSDGHSVYHRDVSYASGEVVGGCSCRVATGVWERGG